MRSNAWQPVGDGSVLRQNPHWVVLLATARGDILGRYSGFDDRMRPDVVWFIDNCLYDGDEPPAWFFVLPSVPRG